MTKEEILKIFSESSALLKGHFLLTSGRHSNQYFQCAKALQYPHHTSRLCKIISDHFKDKSIAVVLSPAMGGIIVGQEVARQLNARAIFAEREEGKLTLRRGFELQKGERVLVCEDVVTTGGSVFETIEIVKQNGAELVGVGSIVDRSSGKVKFGVEQKSCFDIDVISYMPDECPLCKEKLPFVKPGSRKLNK